MDAVHCISASVFVLCLVSNLKLFLDYLRYQIMLGLQQVDAIS